MRQAIAIIALLLLITTAQAEEATCTKLVSNAWVGSFMIKSFPDCSPYKTCFHSALMTIARISNNTFTLTLTPLDKASEPLKTTKHFICKNNVATVIDNITTSVSYTCEYSKCMLKYEDNRMVAAMLEILG